MKAVIISGLIIDLSDNIIPFLDKETDVFVHTWELDENLKWIHKLNRYKKYCNTLKIVTEPEKFESKLFSYVYSTYKAVNSIEDIDKYEYIIKFKPNLDAIRIQYRNNLRGFFIKAKIQSRPLLSNTKKEECIYGSIYYKTLDERMFTGYPYGFKKIFKIPYEEFYKKIVNINSNFIEKYGDYEGSLFWTELIESSGLKLIQDLNLKLPNNKNFNNKVYE